MTKNEINKIEIGTLVLLSQKVTGAKRVAEVVRFATDENYPVKLTYITNVPKHGPTVFGWDPERSKNAKIIGHKNDHSEYYL
jgi:hypothetical protein